MEYEFTGLNGPIKLSQLFAGNQYLMVLHNMGQSCPHCALWGDEFNGMQKHIEKAAAFYVIGPDDPQTQADYIKKRGWNIPLISAAENQFIEDMGFKSDDGYMPGLSVFKKTGNDIECVKQVNVVKDGRIPSVLEALMMIPDADTRSIAWS